MITELLDKEWGEIEDGIQTTKLPPPKGTVEDNYFRIRAERDKRYEMWCEKMLRELA